MALKPLSPRLLFQNTAPNVVGFSSGCTDIRQLGQGTDWEAPSQYRKLSLLGPVYRQFFRVVCNVQYEGKPSRKGKPKQVVICWPGIPQPGLRSKKALPGRPGPQNPVWVSCSCNYFRYVCEWALSRYGSSDIIYSNGQPARTTNPRGIGTLCKHIYAVLPVAIAEWDGEPTEEQAVEETDVEEVPQVPDLSSDEEVSEEDLSLEEDGTLRESFVRAPSGLYVPSLALHAQALRSLVMPFDSKCC